MTSEASPKPTPTPTGEIDSPHEQAEAIVARIVSNWQALGPAATQELQALKDRAMASLAAEANHHLRQALTRISAQLELAAELDKARGVDSKLLEKMPDLEASLDQATRIVSEYLDQNEVTKLLIQLHERPVDLGELLEDAVQRQVIQRGPFQLDAEIEAARIQADPMKLGDSLSYLVEHLVDHASADQEVRVRLDQRGHEVTGFIGLDAGSISPAKLLADLDTPLDLSDQAVDLPYVRAVIERHGGTISVERDADAIGFGFSLPSNRQEDPHERNS